MSVFRGSKWKLRHIRKQMLVKDNPRPLLVLNGEVNISLRVHLRQHSKWRDQQRRKSGQGVSQCLSRVERSQPRFWSRDRAAQAPPETSPETRESLTRQPLASHPNEVNAVSAPNAALEQWKAPTETAATPWGWCLRNVWALVAGPQKRLLRWTEFQRDRGSRQRAESRRAGWRLASHWNCRGNAHL